LCPFLFLSVFLIWLHTPLWKKKYSIVLALEIQWIHLVLMPSFGKICLHYNNRCLIQCALLWDLSGRDEIGGPKLSCILHSPPFAIHAVQRTIQKTALYHPKAGNASMNSSSIALKMEPPAADHSWFLCICSELLKCSTLHSRINKCMLTCIFQCCWKATLVQNEQIEEVAPTKFHET
jgi:hypothetical protein